MEAAIALQLILAITQYCEGPGMAIEQKNTFSKNIIPSEDLRPTCFEKIWNCGHDTKSAYNIPLRTHNCITDHLDGKLK